MFTVRRRLFRLWEISVGAVRLASESWWDVTIFILLKDYKLVSSHFTIVNDIIMLIIVPLTHHVCLTFIGCELCKKGRLARCRHEKAWSIGVEFFPYLLVATIFNQTAIPRIIGAHRHLLTTAELGHSLLVMRKENIKFVGLIDGEVTLVITFLVLLLLV